MRLLLPACACALTLVACRSKETAGPTSDVGGTIVIATPGEPAAVLPPLVGENAGRALSDLIFDRLAEISFDLGTVGDKTFAPRLATSWTWSPDSLSIAFSIDPRARWHDGKPVTAGDVRFTFLATIDPKVASQNAPLLSNVDSVAVRDSLTAVVYYKRRRPEQFYDFVYQLPIMPQHVYGNIPLADLKTAEAARRPIGSGQFRFVRWDAGSRYEIIADTANYRGRPKLDRLIFTVVRDPAVAAAQVLSGQADFFEAFPVDQLLKLDSSSVARGTPLPSNGYAYVAMNPWDRKVKTRPHPIFGDLAVRRALSMAVDRSAMLQNVFGKYGRIGYGPFPRTIASADTTLRLPPYDVTQAAALLDSAGWRAASAGAVRTKNGVPLRFGLMVPTTSLFRMKFAVLLQEQFRKVGAQVDVENVDMGATFLPRQTNGDFDAELALFGTDPAVSGAKQSWSTEGIGPNGQNALRYSNRAVDALLDSASGAFDEAKSKSYSSRAYQKIIDDAPAIWLYDMVTFAGSHRRLKLTPMRADGWHNDVANWSIPHTERIERDRIGLNPATP